MSQPAVGDARRSADAAAPTGPDIGWALACAGLLLAAAILALTGDRGPATGRRRARLARVLPLLGRR